MIAATKRKDKIVIGVTICDNCRNMSTKDLALPDNLPFWKVKGEKACYVCTEDQRYSTDLLRYNDCVFKGITDGESILEKILPRIKDLLGKNDLLINNEEWHNQMLILKENRLFRIDNYFSVSEIDDHATLAFENYLQGALEETKHFDPTESILASLKTLSRLTNRRFFPVTIFDSATKRKKVYYH